MKKTLLILAALALSTALWAQKQTVSYLYPVYNTSDVPTSGIKEWLTGAVGATEVTDETTILSDGWYVVLGDNVQTGTLTCNGAVHLILANGAKLTATGEQNFSNSTPGIQVSGDGNSLAIYGQDAQSGQLIVNGGMYSAGIGGEKNGSGLNITINGGKVTATGGYGAGIGGGCYSSGSNITINGGEVTANNKETGAAGIGGGCYGSGSYITINGGEVTANGSSHAASIGSGWNKNNSNFSSNITINGGKVTANGGDNGAGIGGGDGGTCSDITIDGGEIIATGGGAGVSGIGGKTSSNILISTNLPIIAGNQNPPEGEIINTGSDLADSLNGKQYVLIGGIFSAKAAAIAAIDASVEGVTDESILAIANTAKNNINAATTVEEVNGILMVYLPTAKEIATAAINAAVEGVTDEGILAIANTAKNEIDAATTVEDVNSIKKQALKDLCAAKAIAAINAAIEGLTLFPKEAEYINNMIDLIRQEDDENLVNSTKQTTLEFIALHPAKLDAIAVVNTAMGELAESQTMYNFIGCPAIEAAQDADEIAAAKAEALAKLNEEKTLCDGVYADGKTAGYQRAFDELPTDPQDATGTKVTIIKGDKELKLVNPEKVEFGKQ